MSDHSQEPPVLTEVKNQTLYITLNRPRVLNAHNQEMRTALVAALDLLDHDDQIRLGVLRGAGDRAFSSGADMKEMERTRGGEDLVPISERATMIHFRRLEKVRKPIIAAIDGYAWGGGLELAILCDFRVATQASTFAMPEPRSVRGAGEVAVHRLARMIPLGEALRLHLTASPITAERAYAVGLIQYLAADADAMAEIIETVAEQIKECDDEVLQAVKFAARRTTTMTIEESELLFFELQRASAAGRRVGQGVDA